MQYTNADFAARKQKKRVRSPASSKLENRRPKLIQERSLPTSLLASRKPRQATQHQYPSWTQLIAANLRLNLRFRRLHGAAAQKLGNFFLAYPKLAQNLDRLLA